MKIGLIIYSQSGNTRSVGEELKEKLASAGHKAVLEEITITGDVPAQAGKFKLENVPDADNYEALVFGAPVQAFSLNPVMKAYMQQLPLLSGKRVAIFVTKHLPMLWFGGTGAVAIMKKACEERGTEVLGSEIVVWAEKKRRDTIRQCVDGISRLFSH